MKCARCLAELPRQSQFCLRCGAPVEGALGNTLQMPQGFGASSLNPPRQNTRLLAAIVALLAVLATALGAMVIRTQLAQKAAASSPTGKMVQSPGATPQAKLTQDPGANNGTQLVQAPGNNAGTTMVEAPGAGTGTPMTQQPGATTGPPADVVDYLAFLRQIEASKKKLIHDETADLAALKDTLPIENIKKLLDNVDMGGDGPAVDPAKKSISKTAKTATAVADDWNQLAIAFNQRTPPESCRQLHDAYYDHLGKVQAGILNVYSVLDKAFSGDPNKTTDAYHDAMSMQGSSGDVDVAMRKADDALAEVCKTFHLTKDFDISEGSSSSLVH